jgi:hypothetical protein
MVESEGREMDHARRTSCGGAAGDRPRAAGAGRAEGVGRAAGDRWLPDLPAGHRLEQAVDTLPLDASSGAYVSSIGTSAGLKADFGRGLWNGAPIGIPYNTTSATQAPVPVSFEI